MSFEFGQFTEFSDPVAKKDPVVLAVAKAIELGPFKGAFYQGMGAPDTPLTNKQFDIYSRSKTSRDGLIGDGAAGGWDNVAVSGLKMPADILKGLNIGHVLQVEDEVVIIKAVDRAANTIDVYARGAGDSTAAAHADQTAFSVIGYAGADTDLKNVKSMSELTSVYSNYVQTIFEVMDWTKHAIYVGKGLSVADATYIIVQEAMIRVAETLARMSIHGRKQKAVDDSDRYMSAGLYSQLTDTNNGNRAPLLYNNTGALAEEKVVAAIKMVFDAGGVVDTIWASPTNKGIINTFNMANSQLAVQTTKADHTAGVYIDSIDFEGHIIKVRVDSDMGNNRLPIVKQSDCQKGWLTDDGLQKKDEPSASSREVRKSIQGSVGFIVENVGVNHILMDGITG
jgi:predicted nucleic acid-binding protein